ncbi:MAG: hypothetical protein A3G44_11710 [Candidatus Rokubacteria bacterium RIFCSPLOWO2_12_FULL_73_47]|nr:MAG: hypothetical protein A3G44_11710 [Candidatus Rokubacteria bacterium RIFCSPLOWO2_12_FULL_73_47]
MSARVSVFGLGYVGSVSAACLAEAGHRVIGVDIRAEKVAAVGRGEAPVVEPGLDALVAAAVAAGRLTSTSSGHEAVLASDLSLICVGTPRDAAGVDLRAVRAAAEEIGGALRAKAGYHVVVVRSTVPPGTSRGLVLPSVEGASGRTAGRGFGVCVHPEFLREGSAVEDVRRAARAVVGELDAASGEPLVALYRGLATPTIRTGLEAAELLKYADNAWHALKVCFANELGSLATRLGVDGAALLDLLRRDTRLNLSGAYLTPGLPFGGSCLPKDVRALGELGRSTGLSLPVLDAILPSNDAHLERALARVRAAGARRLGFLGLAFKPGTDDVRGSPALALLVRLRAEGYAVRVHDVEVAAGRLLGANRAFLEQCVPDLERLVAADAAALAATVEALVVTQDTALYRGVVRARPPGVALIDLVGLDARPAPPGPDASGC